MAWNPSPKVAAARDIGEKFGKQEVIVIMIDHRSGTMEYASWGTTVNLCRSAKKKADVAYEAVEEYLSNTQDTYP